MISKILSFIKDRQSDLVLASVIILITALSFNMGRITERNRAKTPITIKDGIDIANGRGVRSVGGNNTDSGQSARTDLSVVASKKSASHFYHFSWCPGASKISAQNKLSFPTEAAAISAGFQLASNCKK